MNLKPLTNKYDSPKHLIQDELSEDERKELVTKYLQFKELMNKIDEDEEEDGEGGPGSENPRRVCSH